MNRSTSPTRYEATTTDGWNLALYRYQPTRGAIKGQAPIFLCHGLGANRYNLDAPGKMSFARWIASQGFDAWVVELRGAGKSTRPSLFNKFKYNWTFDDYVHRDAPAAIEKVLQVTGAPQVHWLGHSMGGMIAYAYLMTQGQDRVRSIVTVGSPAMAHAAHPILKKVLGLRHVLRRVPAVPYASASFLLAPAMPLFKNTAGWLFGNPRNLGTRDMMKLICTVPSNLPTSLMAQFGDWIAESGFAGLEGQVPYYSELSRITVPALLIAGAVDILTPPREIEYVHDEIRSTDKTLMTFGRANGCKYDYGHIDLILGKTAPKEVWPHILTFLTDH
ncbi:MAG: pimeloyl-ACP methyl ester carboxylesterase [Myxococcota bacterium]